ncbi:MAG: GNAT family N-acetyltransferase [Pseudomonadota bacterium]
MIKSRRLSLRKWRGSDRAQLRLILGDPEVMEFSDQGALSEAQQTSWLDEACLVSRMDLLSGPLAITRRAEDLAVGYIRLSTEPGRVKTGAVELGIRLARRMWGQGYATEAAAAMIDAAKTIPSISELVAIVDPNNERSIRLLEKLGMAQDGEIMFDGYDYPDAVYVLKLRTDATDH